MSDSRFLGTVARLQVHPDFVIKEERYDPGRLLVTDRIAVTSAGVVGRSGDSWVIDVHHAAHPWRRPGRLRPVSVGFTPAYDMMRARFGDTATLGAAAENIIIDTEWFPSIGDLRSGLVVRGEGGHEIRLDDAMVANPCREFTSYLLGLRHAAEQDEIADDHRFLRHGMRGYIFSAGGISQPIEIATGDEVFLVSGATRRRTAA